MASDIPSDIALLAGPPLLGHLFNYGLFGVLCVQVYNYYLQFPNDPPRLKAFIYGLFVVECVQIVLATHDAFAVFGAGWGDLNALNSPQWLWFDFPLMSGIVSATVQIFFAWRIFIISRSRVLAIFIALVAVMQGSAGIATGIITGPMGTNNNALIQQQAQATLIVWLGGSSFCDVLIAVCMIYLLSKEKQGLASDKLISRLIRVTVETGSVTASFATLDLILCMVFKHNNLHMTPAFILSKLYTNSLMLIFNNRAQLRSMRSAVNTFSGGGGGSGQSSHHFQHSHGRSLDGTSTFQSHRGPQEISLGKLSGSAEHHGRPRGPAHVVVEVRTERDVSPDIDMRKAPMTEGFEVV